MIEVLTLHEGAFYEYFKPYRHPNAQHDIWGGHGLEAFDSDLALVHRLDPLISGQLLMANMINGSQLGFTS